MREIKFRYWDKKGGEFWDEPKELNYFVFSYGHNYSDAGEDEDRIIFGGQYTGIKDKNGKEIYEGDILKAERPPYEGNTEVKWDSEHGCFLKYPQYGYYLGDDIVTTEDEVIGNIHENAGLLAAAPPCP